MIPPLPFRLAVVLLACAPVVAFGQAGNWWSLRGADSTGFVPVERLELIEPLDDGNLVAAHSAQSPA